MRLVTLAIAVVLSAAVGACGDSDSRESAPAACLGGAEVYLAALEDAPGDVRLEGQTPISDCLVEGQGGGQLATVGESAIEAATKLNERALKDPASDATVQLGYLVGAMQEGASATGGIHADLIRRLDTAARFTQHGESPSAAFERAFGEGYAAGQARG